MKCPTCADSPLVMTERSGIEIDYCPTCRGVWLDRGELDKIIERSAADQRVDRPAERAAAPAPRSAEPAPAGRWDDDDDDEWRSGREAGRAPRKRRSLLGELFDF